MSRGFQRAFHEHIYIREHTARRHAATQRRRVLAFHGRSSSLSALLAESPAHPHSPTPTPCPEGLTSRQCHPQLPVSRVTACPLVCAVRAHLITSAQQKPFVPNSPSFLHSPSFVRLSTSSHTLCSAYRDRSPLSHAILGAGHFDFHRREYLLAASNSALG